MSTCHGAQAITKPPCIKQARKATQAGHLQQQQQQQHALSLLCAALLSPLQAAEGVSSATSRGSQQPAAGRCAAQACGPRRQRRQPPQPMEVIRAIDCVALCFAPPVIYYQATEL